MPTRPSATASRSSREGSRLLGRHAVHRADARGGRGARAGWLLPQLGAATRPRARGAHGAPGAGPALRPGRRRSPGTSPPSSRQHAAAGFAALGETRALGGRPAPPRRHPAQRRRLQLAAAGRAAGATPSRAWWPERPRIPLLRHDSLELAVARGAAYYGLVRRGHRAEASAAARRAPTTWAWQRPADSAEQPVLCLIPRGFEEGQTVDLGERPFTLTLGRPVQFTLYSTTADRIDKPGDVVALAEDLKPLPPIHTRAQGRRREDGRGASAPAGRRSPRSARWSCSASRTWRTSAGAWSSSCAAPGARRELTVTESMPARFAEAKENIERVYGNKPLPDRPQGREAARPRRWRSAGPARDAGGVPVLRELWSSLFAGRRQAAPHRGPRARLLQPRGLHAAPGLRLPAGPLARASRPSRLFEPLVQFHTEKAGVDRVLGDVAAHGRRPDRRRSSASSGPT